MGVVSHWLWRWEQKRSTFEHDENKPKYMTPLYVIDECRG